MPRRLAGLLLAAALGAGSLAGCGGGQSNDQKTYVEKINKAQSDYLREIGKIPAVTRDLDKASDSVAGMASQAAGLQNDIGDIKPPDEVKTEHAKLETTTKTYATALAGVSTEMKAGVKAKDRKKIAGALRQLQSAASKFGSDFGATIQAINRKIAS